MLVGRASEQTHVRQKFDSFRSLNMVEPLSDAEVECLDPGIRDVVVQLRAAGFETTDSGDGVSKPKDDMCVLDHPHVFAVTTPELIIHETDRLSAFLGPEWHVEGQYCPKDGKVFLSAAKMDPVAIWNARADRNQT
jgi:hypothetical protein